jgi:hypothetical protein
MRIESTNHNLNEGDVIRFTTSLGGTLPTGLVLETDYYVRDDPFSTGDTFYVSTSVAGTRIVYTDGCILCSGIHFWSSEDMGLYRIYDDILDDLDDTLGDIEKNRRVIIEINYE